MNAVEYKHIVFSLIFFKNICDTSVRKQGKVENMLSEPSNDHFINENAATYAEQLDVCGCFTLGNSS